MSDDTDSPAEVPRRGGYELTSGGNRRRSWKPSKHRKIRIRREVMLRDNGTCQHCGATSPDFDPATYSGCGLLWINRRDWLELDHVIPYRDGGQFTASNLQVLCGPCNRRKGAGR